MKFSLTAGFMLPLLRATATATGLKAPHFRLDETPQLDQ
jgi:hypothetical protein